MPYRMQDRSKCQFGVKIYSIIWLGVLWNQYKKKIKWSKTLHTRGMYTAATKCGRAIFYICEAQC